MRKSTWLLSAGIVAMAAPAFAQEPQGSTTTAAQEPAEAAAAAPAAEEDSQKLDDQIIVTATRRNEALSDARAGRFRSDRPDDAELGAVDIRAQPGFSSLASRLRRKPAPALPASAASARSATIRASKPRWQPSSTAFTGRAPAPL
jgi:hypothetical protein